MKRPLHIAGGILSVIAIVWVLYAFGGELRNVNYSEDGVWQGLFGAVALYVLVLVIGAFAWKGFMIGFGETPRPWMAERHLLISQLGKYVPGNVAQYIGRVAMAANDGLSATRTGAAMVFETMATIAMGLLVAAVGLMLLPDLRAELADLLPNSARIAILVFVVACAAIGLLIAARMLGRRDTTVKPLLLGKIALYSLIYPFSFLLLGASVQMVAGVTNPTAPVSLALATTVYAAAWIIGLVTPGAPGGLGVRETVLTLGLTPILGGPAALAVALVHRALCVVGDVIAFGIGLALPKPKQR